MKPSCEYMLWRHLQRAGLWAEYNRKQNVIFLAEALLVPGSLERQLVEFFPQGFPAVYECHR